MSSLDWQAALDVARLVLRRRRPGGGVYLLWYARYRQQQRREPVAVVGLVLVLISAALGVLAWQGTHRQAATVQLPGDSRPA